MLSEILISAPLLSSLLYREDTNVFLETNQVGRFIVVTVLLKVALTISTIPILPSCVTLICAFSQVPTISSLKLIRFSTVENLQRYEVLDKSSETNYTSLIFSKIGLIGHVFVDIPAAISKSLREGTLLFTFPDGYRPKSFNLKLIISHFSGQTARTRYDASTGKVYILSPLNIAESMYLDTMYILES